MARPVRLAKEAAFSLRSHPGRTLLMALGVLIGTASLTTVLFIAQGTRERIMGLVAKHGWDMLMVRAGAERVVGTPVADRALASLSEADAAAIEAGVPNVLQVAAVQNQRGWESVFGENSVKTRIFGVSPSWTDIRRRPIARGEGIAHEDMLQAARVCILGAKTAKTLFGDADPIGQTIRIGSDPYRVKGLFAEVGASATGEDWDDRIVIPYATSSKRLFGRAYLEQIVIQVADPRRIAETAEQVRALLRERHGIRQGGDDDFFVREPKDIQETALATSTTLTKLLVGVSVVSLLGGGIMIMNIMLLSVSQRRSEIGLRRAVGARRGDITLQFLLESLGVSVIGGLAGILGGLALASILSRMGVASSQVTWPPFAAALGTSLVVALAFGLYPARKAAHVDPVVALRGKGA